VPNSTGRSSLMSHEMVEGKHTSTVFFYLKITVMAYVKKSYEEMHIGIEFF
jgi:hypothetical protein